MSFPGIPHLHPIILPLVPCPFWATPSCPGQECTSPCSGQGVPHPVMAGASPCLGLRYPQKGPGASQWGTPGQDRMEYSPRSYLWTGYGAAGTPLAVSRRRTVLFYCKIDRTFRPQKSKVTYLREKYTEMLRRPILIPTKTPTPTLTTMWWHNKKLFTDFGTNFFRMQCEMKNMI